MSIRLAKLFQAGLSIFIVYFTESGRIVCFPVLNTSIYNAVYQTKPSLTFHNIFPENYKGPPASNVTHTGTQRLIDSLYS